MTTIQNQSFQKQMRLRVCMFPAHYSIKHSHKAYKVRVVFDCAAKCKGLCLNDALMQRPNLTNSLINMLSRFRQEHVVFVGDMCFHPV